MSKIDVKAIRTQLGWTQQRLADELGVTQGRICQYEDGDEPSAPIKKLLGIIMTRRKKRKAATQEGDRPAG